jgi:hypothetical protein
MLFRFPLIEFLNKIVNIVGIITSGSTDTKNVSQKWAGGVFHITQDTFGAVHRFRLTQFRYYWFQYFSGGTPYHYIPPNYKGLYSSGAFQNYDSSEFCVITNQAITTAFYDQLMHVF